MKPALLTTLAALTCTLTTQAALVLSNLDTPTADSWPVNAGDLLAQSFHVGTAAPSYTLDELSILVESVTNDTAPITLSIYTDSATGPATGIGTLSATLTPTGPGIYTFASTTPLTLTADTTYWIVANTSGPAIYNWALTRDGGHTAQDGWNIDEDNRAMAYLYEGSPAWDIYEGETNNGIGPLLFSISATPIPIPEPSSLLLLGTTTLAFTLRRTRRK